MANKKFGEVQRRLEKAIKEYKSKKNAKTRDELSESLSDYMREAKDDVSIIPDLFITNQLLPPSSRMPMYALFTSEDLVWTDTNTVPLDKLTKPAWDYIPTNQLKAVKVKPVEFKINPTNKNLAILMSDVTSRDGLRPPMMGVEFDEDGVVGTDAHQLLRIVGKKDGKFKDGIYAMSSDSIKHTHNQYDHKIQRTEESVEEAKKLVKEFPKYKTIISKNNTLIKDLKQKREAIKKESNPMVEGNYVNWRGVLPNAYSESNKVRINLPLLTSILTAVINNQLINPHTYQIKFDLPKMEIAFNARMFNSLAQVFMRMGINEVDFHYYDPLKGAIMTKVGDADNNDFQDITFGMIMPTSLHYGSPFTELKITDTDSIQIAIGKTKPKVLTYSDFSSKKTSPKKEPKTSNKDFLRNKIEGFKIMLEIEEDKMKRQFLKDKIEAFEIMKKMKNGGETEKPNGFVYIYKTISCYKNIKIVRITKSTKENPVPKSETTVYVDGKRVVRHERWVAEQRFDNANLDEIETVVESNF